MDVVKLTDRIMVVDVSIDKTLVVVKIIDKTGYVHTCLLSGR
jgi:hypothetical protein